MLVRVILIVVVVLVLLRAIVRLAVRLAAAMSGGGSPRSGAEGRAAPTAPDRVRRHLVECPACGTFFESGRGRPALWRPASGEPAPMVCSEACRHTEPGQPASA